MHVKVNPGVICQGFPALNVGWLRSAKKERIFKVSYQVTLMQARFNGHFVDQFKVWLKWNVRSTCPFSWYDTCFPLAAGNRTKKTGILTAHWVDDHLPSQSVGRAESRSQKYDCQLHSEVHFRRYLVMFDNVLMVSVGGRWEEHRLVWQPRRKECSRWVIRSLWCKEVSMDIS
jgi:hypothetical protein